MADLLQNVIQQASSSVPAMTDLVSTSLRSVTAKTTAQTQLMRWTASGKWQGSVLVLVDSCICSQITISDWM